MYLFVEQTFLFERDSLVLFFNLFTQEIYYRLISY